MELIKNAHALYRDNGPLSSLKLPNDDAEKHFERRSKHDQLTERPKRLHVSTNSIASIFVRCENVLDSYEIYNLRVCTEESKSALDRFLNCCLQGVKVLWVYSLRRWQIPSKHLAATVHR